MNNLQKIWNADDIFINDVKKDVMDPMSTVASKLIRTNGNFRF